MVRRCVNLSGKATVAVRILLAINNGQSPKESEVTLLRAYCRDQETPISDLAFRVSRELYEQLKNAPRAGKSPAISSLHDSFPSLNPLGGPNDQLRTRERLGSAQDGR